jgi:anti-sigma B factor antagonist
VSRSLRLKASGVYSNGQYLTVPTSTPDVRLAKYFQRLMVSETSGDARAYTAIRSTGALLAYRSPPPYNLPMAAEPLTIERLSAQEGPRVLCLRGPLTLENLPLFQNAIRREENVPMVIVDLSDVPYIDSSGLGSLVSAYVTRHKATRRIALSGVNERVLKLFETTKVEPLFLIFPTLDDAIAGLTTAAEA